MNRPPYAAGYGTPVAPVAAGANKPLVGPAVGGLAAALVPPNNPPGYAPPNPGFAAEGKSDEPAGLGAAVPPKRPPGALPPYAPG